MRTPAHMAATPSHGLQGVDAATIQRATAGLPNSVFNTLAQVAGNTPGFPQAQQGMVNTSFEHREYNIISSISVRFNLIRKCVDTVPGAKFFFPLEVVSRYRDPQVQVGKKYICLISHKVFFV